jgi:uncharacterized protein (TIGR02147 family)
MRVFSFKDYKVFITDQIKNMPQKGHGQYRKLAAHLNVSSVQISHIFKGPRHLTDDQALDCAAYFNLDASETDYFVTLVLSDRAATVRLKNYYLQQLKKMRDVALATKNRLQKDLELPENAQARYYANWFHGAIRISCLIKGMNTPAKIAEYLHLPLKIVEETIEFLIDTNLLQKTKSGTLESTNRTIFLEKSSPFIFRHHANWRMKGIENMMNVNDSQEMFFTCPMTISQEHAVEIRTRFIDVIEEVMKKVNSSVDEHLHCLNIDWFKVKR